MARRPAVLLATAALLAGGCGHVAVTQRSPGSPVTSAAAPPAPLPAVSRPPTPARPDLSGYPAVGVDRFLTDDQYGSHRSVRFRTPDGLDWRVGRGAANCAGDLPGTTANEIGLGGFARTAEPAGPAAPAPPVLDAGHRIDYEGAKCAVAPGPATMCVGGQPSRWFTVAPDGSGVGPATAGLPAGFPDPKDYVFVDEGPYHVGSGAKNIKAYFTTASGLTCELWSFSGYEFGCDGPLPAAPHGENEIYLAGMADGGHPAGMRRTDKPRFVKTHNPGEIRRLPPGYALSYDYEARGACLATFDGGAACYLYGFGESRPFQGFLATPTDVRTFG